MFQLHVHPTTTCCPCHAHPRALHHAFYLHDRILAVPFPRCFIAVVQPLRNSHTCPAPPPYAPLVWRHYPYFPSYPYLPWLNNDVVPVPCSNACHTRQAYPHRIYPLLCVLGSDMGSHADSSGWRCGRATTRRAPAPPPPPPPPHRTPTPRHPLPAYIILPSGQYAVMVSMDGPWTVDLCCHLVQHARHFAATQLPTTCHHIPPFRTLHFAPLTHTRQAFHR